MVNKPSVFELSRFDCIWQSKTQDSNSWSAFVDSRQFATAVYPVWSVFIFLYKLAIHLMKCLVYQIYSKNFRYITAKQQQQKTKVSILWWPYIIIIIIINQWVLTFLVSLWQIAHFRISWKVGSFKGRSSQYIDSLHILLLSQYLLINTIACLYFVTIISFHKQQYTCE